VAARPASFIRDAVFDIFLPLAGWPVVAILTATGSHWLLPAAELLDHVTAYDRAVFGVYVQGDQAHGL
jgi:hypothetical protein